MKFTTTRINFQMLKTNSEHIAPTVERPVRGVFMTLCLSFQIFNIAILSKATDIDDVIFWVHNT